MNKKKLIIASLLALFTLTSANTDSISKNKTEELVVEYAKYKEIDSKDYEILTFLFENNFIKENIFSLYNEDVRKEIRNLAEYFDIPPLWFYQLFYYESGLNPKARNKKSNASGLIQFMPFTAENLGTSPKELREMSIVEQLSYVKLFLERVNPSKNFNDFQDLYLAVFFPKAINKNNTYVFGSHRDSIYISKVAKLNPAININKDESITKGEFSQYCDKINKKFNTQNNV